MYGIDILVEEHRNIKSFNEVVKKISLLLLQGIEIDIEDLRFAIKFIREYADDIHHGKEEDILFVYMEEELGQIGKNLISHGMLVEHDLARYYVSEFVKAIDEYEKEVNEDTRLNLISYMMSYRDLLERHIYKEDEVVYSYAIKQLSTENMQVVDRKTKEFEETVDNVDKKAYYLENLRALREKYKI